MARNPPQPFDLPITLIAITVASATPTTSAGQTPIVSRAQADTAVSIDQLTGFTLVTHKPWIAEAEPFVRALGADRRFVVESPQRTDSSLQETADFRRASYLRSITAAEARYALPNGLLDALVWTESRYNAFAVSSRGAIGLGQLMPGTARDMGVRNRLDPLANIDGAAHYLRLLIDKFRLIHLALAAYNAGPTAVERSGGIPLNGQTPRYVQDVLRRWKL